jgi:hypothetical protein
MHEVYSQIEPCRIGMRPDMRFVPIKSAEMIGTKTNRISSEPAVIAPHQQAGHMTEADQIVQTSKSACQ